MSKIKIEGESKQFQFDDVSESVIKLSSKYFWRNDTDRVVRINVNGKQRYYRKASPLICNCTTTQRYELKENCYETDSGLFLFKDHINTIKIGDAYYESRFVVSIKGKHYTIHDDRVIRINSTYHLKEDTIVLSETFYPGNVRVLNTHSTKEIYCGTILSSDAVEILNSDGSIIFDHRHSEKVLHLRSALYDFHDRLHPDIRPRRCKMCFVQTDVEVSESTILGHDLVVESRRVELETIYSNFIELRDKKSINKIRTAINNNYSEVGPDENQAKKFSLSYERYPGNSVLFQPTKDLEIKISKSLDLTGGIGYTFGVEVESSAGLMNNLLCEKHTLLKVGDGSIGAAEYVTKPLHGDLGVEVLKGGVESLSQNVLVDDRCSVHIHVGGADGAEIPNFDDKYLTSIIKLGTMIEKDLYSISPISRRPDFKHCHSIIQYSGINMKNYKKYLGRYLFGPRERFGSEFSLRGYEFGSTDQNRDVQLGLYAASRYKWLNLINAATRGRHKTTEIRMFGGTTSFEKIYSYLLISLATVKFSETSQDVIFSEKNISLIDMLKAVYTDKVIIDPLVNFVESRFERFKRGDVYKDLIEF